MKYYFSWEKDYFLGQKYIKKIKKKNIKHRLRFSDQGKQGVTGILDITVKGQTSFPVVYKVSQYINNLGKHEANILQELGDISEFCPHFSRLLKISSIKVDKNFIKTPNLFERKGKHHITTDMTLQPYYTGEKLLDIIKKGDIAEEVFFSTTKQVLFAIAIAQKYKNFAHYDLHSANILMQKCDENDVFVYSLDDENTFAVPTHGYCPVIIDYGFSYIDNMKNRPIFSSLAHTDVGFMTNEYNRFSDPKLFLVTISEELKNYKSSENCRTLRNIVRNIYKSLNIDWESGWDIYNKPGAAYYITRNVKNLQDTSDFFNKYNQYCVDIIQSMIQLPLESKDTSFIEPAYITLTNEFSKFEKEISHPTYLLYLLKKIVRFASRHQEFYLNDEKACVRQFRTYVHSVLSEIAAFCNPKEVSYDKLLCSLYVFANCCEGIIYQQIQIKHYEKDREYDLVELDTPEKIYGALEINLQEKNPYVYHQHSRIHFFDCETGERNLITNLTEECVYLLNHSNPIVHGTIIKDLLINDNLVYNTKLPKKSEEIYPEYFKTSVKEPEEESEAEEEELEEPEVEEESEAEDEKPEEEVKVEESEPEEEPEEEVKVEESEAEDEEPEEEVKVEEVKVEESEAEDEEPEEEVKVEESEAEDEEPEEESEEESEDVVEPEEEIDAEEEPVHEEEPKEESEPAPKEESEPAPKEESEPAPKEESEAEEEPKEESEEPAEEPKEETKKVTIQKRKYKKSKKGKLTIEKCIQVKRKLNKKELRFIARLSKDELVHLIRLRSGKSPDKTSKKMLLETLDYFEETHIWKKGYDKLLSKEYRITEKDHPQLSKLSKTQLMGFVYQKYGVHIQKTKKKLLIEIANLEKSI
jgi:hypothetical protein